MKGVGKIQGSPVHEVGPGWLSLRLHCMSTSALRGASLLHIILCNSEPLPPLLGDAAGHRAYLRKRSATCEEGTRLVS